MQLAMTPKADKNSQGAEEMAHQLRTCTALTEDPSSIFSIRSGLYTIAYNSSSREQGSLFWSPGEPALSHTYWHRETQTHIVSFFFQFKKDSITMNLEERVE